MKRMLLTLLCVNVLGLFSLIVHSQTRDNFVSLEGRFTIALPRTYAEFRPATIVAGKELLPIMLYKWNTTSGLVAAGYAVTGVDLEDPKLAPKIFRDVRDSFIKQYEAKLLTEHARVFDGHQGFEFIIENKSLLTAVRMILAKNRFYMLTLTNRPDQRDLVANGEGLLSTFRLMSLDDVVAARDRSLGTLPGSPYSQTAAGTDTRPDAQNEKFKGRVKQIFVERELLFNGVSFNEVHPESLKDFNEDGYVSRVITFSGQWPASISLYGFAGDSRAFKKMLISEVTWRLGRQPTLNIDDEAVHIVRQKYDASDRLIEQGIYDEKGSLEERVAYKYETERREIETRKYSNLFGDKFETLSKTVERLDASGNPVELTLFQYSQGPGGFTTTINNPVNPHDRVAGAITSGPLNSNSVKNPRAEERAVVTTSKTQNRVIEEKFVYTYEFDAQGNWIKRITTSKDRGKNAPPIDVTYRRITYY